MSIDNVVRIQTGEGKNEEEIQRLGKLNENKQRTTKTMIMTC